MEHTHITRTHTHTHTHIHWGTPIQHTNTTHAQWMFQVLVGDRTQSWIPFLETLFGVGPRNM